MVGRIKLEVFMMIMMNNGLGFDVTGFCDLTQITAVFVVFLNYPWQCGI